MEGSRQPLLPSGSRGFCRFWTRPFLPPDFFPLLIRLAVAIGVTAAAASGSGAITFSDGPIGVFQVWFRHLASADRTVGGWGGVFHFSPSYTPDEWGEGNGTQKIVPGVQEDSIHI